MNALRFDSLTRRAAGASSRRGALRALATGALGLALGLPGRGADAKACLGTGKACKRGNQCCSGRCAGKKGKKTCRRAPGQGTCTIKRDFCEAGSPARGCNGSLGCACYVTTGGTSFCGGVGLCTPCATAADCAEAGFPAGSACVQAAGTPTCGVLCSGGGETICVPPCAA